MSLYPHCLFVSPRFLLAATPAPTPCAASSACICSPSRCPSRCAPASSVPGVIPSATMATRPFRACTASAPTKPPYPCSRRPCSAFFRSPSWKSRAASSKRRRTSISRDARNKLLKAQGVYLRALYAALVFQLGELAALAEFQRLLLKVV